MNEETFVSIIDKFYLLKDIEHKPKTEFINVPVGSIREPLLLYLLMDLKANKKFLTDFCEFMEEKAFKTNNPYELSKINEFLEIKPLIDNLDMFSIPNKADFKSGGL